MSFGCGALSSSFGLGWVGLELEEEERMRMRMEAPHKVNECCLQCNGGATLLGVEWSGM